MHQSTQCSGDAVVPLNRSLPPAPLDTSLWSLHGISQDTKGLPTHFHGNVSSTFPNSWLLLLFYVKCKGTMNEAEQKD